MRVSQVGSPTAKAGHRQPALRIEGRYRASRFAASLTAIALVVAALVLASPGSATSRDEPLSPPPGIPSSTIRMPR
jgi:hypothetical protein